MRVQLWLAGCGLCVAFPAFAQQSAPADPPADPAPAADIVVTGSRIVRPDFRAPNPIVSTTAKDIVESGQTNVTNFLLRVPALTNSVDSTQTAGVNRLNAQPFGAAGLNLLDLRGLGSARTLVLVDGRRHVSGQINTAAVDINAIPTDLIERVDVLTGSASAVYGADGVSGMVNFIMKRNFEGVQARSQFGISRYGDAGNRFGSLTAGHNFAGGRGNATLSYEYNADDPVGNDDRPFLRQDRRRYLIPNDARTTDPKATALILQGDLRYPNESQFGAVDVDGDGVPDLRGDGKRYDPGRSVAYYGTGGDNTPVAGFVGDLLPHTVRHAVNALGTYEFSPAAKLSLDAKFVHNTVTTFDSFTGNYPATLSIDNPFMPASIRAAAIAAGQTTVSSTRDNFDLGRKGETNVRRTYRVVADLTGQLTPHARYDVYYTYGQTDVRITKLGDRLNDRFLAALDVVTDPRTGRPTCRSNLNPAALQAPATTFTPGANSGCVPINTFGAYTIDPAARAFVQVPYDSSAQITQSVANASLTGDFGALFRLPGGPVAFAVGGEYRRETSRFDPSSLLTSNAFYQYDEFVIPSAVRGRFTVAEAFGELNAPLLSDVPFARTLSVGAAGRYSHYSTIGDTKTYAFNAVYAPVSDVTFRGTYGQSIRAPNISEIFSPVTGTSNFFVDPCYPENRNSGTTTRAANCIALLNGLGANAATFTAANNPNAGVFIPGSFQGNAGLRPERARTWTAGVVLRPGFLPGLSVGVDWYDIKLNDAISTPDPNTVANLCVDQPTINNAYCASITRLRGSGFISGFVVQPQNVAQFRTAGLDLTVAYRLRTQRAGDFDLRFVGGYLNRLDIIATPGAQVEDQVDQPGRPEFNFVFSPTWTLGRYHLAYNLRWFDATRRFPKNATDNDPNYAPANLIRYRALWQHDVQLAIDIDRRMSIYGGVNNLTDRQPDEDSYNLPAPALGRYFYAGARVRLGRRN